MRLAFCPTRSAHPLSWLLALALSGAAVSPNASAAVDTPDNARAAANRPSTVKKSIKSSGSFKTAKSAKSATSSRSAKAAAPRRALKTAASDLALASATVEAINDAQFGIAARVLTGDAECEFNQHITVLPEPDQPGHFRVSYKNLRYHMVPRETPTGAVRLEDPTAGIVWLQIPTKSMLMNARIGQRLVDACTHAEQRVALAAVADAANGLGILPSATTMSTATAAPGPVSALPGSAGAPNPDPAVMASVAAASAVAAATLAAQQTPLIPPVPPLTLQASEAPRAAPPDPAAGAGLPLCGIGRSCAGAQSDAANNPTQVRPGVAKTQEIPG
jgi:hypothetical protein